MPGRRRSRCGVCLQTLTPEEIVKLINFRDIDDGPGRRSLGDSPQQEDGQGGPDSELEGSGYPAYTTSVGWYGFTDDQVRQLCQEALAAGWTIFS